MSQCVSCHFYDRKSARASDARGLQWGLCRRDAPHLNPVNAKMHAIEGVWPTVRDDDWCGQWQAERRHNAPGTTGSIVQSVTATQVVAAARAGAPVPAPRVLPVQGGAAAIAAGFKPTPGTAGN